MLLEVDPTVIARFLRKLRRFNGAPEGMTARTFDKRRYFGMVIDDKALRPGKSLDQCAHVRAMRQHFVDGLEWCETEYSRLYDKKYRKMERHGGKKGNFNVFARKKLEKYDSIFEDMKSNGYKQSASIEENIEVALDASGEFLLIDGRHRLVLAQLLGLKKIPVVINLIAESFAKTFGEDSEGLRIQLQSQTIDQRLNSLIAIPGGRRGKGVLVNSFQRSHFPE